MDSRVSADRRPRQIAKLPRAGAFGALLLSGILLVLMQPSPVSADQSVAKTTAWLAQNLPSLAIADDGFGNVTQEVSYSFDGCVMRVKDRLSNIESSDPAHTQFYAITFKPMPRASLYAEPPFGHKFQPQAATASQLNFGFEDNVAINLKNIDVSSMRVHSYVIDSSQPQTSAASTMVFGSKEVDIATTDSDLAERALKALRHAATLCGAASSGF